MDTREQIMEGPKETIIPEQRFYSCSGCQYYSRSMVKSGMHPIYKSTCSHLSIDIFLNMFHVPETPDGCLFLQSKIRDDKINKVID
jgi:hypothetical protein